MPNGDDGDKVDGSAWRMAELLFGGGVIVWAAGTVVTGLWWASDINRQVQDLQDTDTGFAHRLETLDNIALGNRITAVETRVGTMDRTLENVDKKLDRLLERSPRANRTDPN
jgi:hypothetical protein